MLQNSLVTVVKAAIGGLLNLLDPQSRKAIAADGKIPGERLSLASAQLSFQEIDFPGIKAIASKQMELQNCENRNIDPYEDGSFKGWRLRARCSGGRTMIVFVDINSHIDHIDLES